MYPGTRRRYGWASWRGYNKKKKKGKAPQFAAGLDLLSKPHRQAKSQALQMLLKKLKLHRAGSSQKIRGLKRQVQRRRRRRVWSVGTHWKSCRNSGNSLKVCMDKEGMGKIAPCSERGLGT